jgi:hypothetical protein
MASVAVGEMGAAGVAVGMVSEAVGFPPHAAMNSVNIKNSRGTDLVVSIHFPAFLCDTLPFCIQYALYRIARYDIC